MKPSWKWSGVIASATGLTSLGPISSPLPCQLRLALRGCSDRHLRYTGSRLRRMRCVAEVLPKLRYGRLLGLRRDGVSCTKELAALVEHGAGYSMI